jgi:hypothetical protein
MATISLSRVQVLNDALRIVGVGLIANPSEASEGARQTNGVFDRIVAQELAKNAWYFAKQQIALPALAETPVYKFPFSYQLPGDFVRLVELEDMWVFSYRQGGAYPQRYYEMHGTKLLTAFPAPLNITYLKNLGDDTSAWPAYFSTVVSAAIACEVANPLTKSETQVTIADRAYKTAISNCARLNAIQLAPDEQPDNSWMTARLQ